MPALRIVDVDRGRYLLAHGAPDPQAQAAGKPWAAATWLFFIERLGDACCRVISRFRAACSDDLAADCLIAHGAPTARLFACSRNN
jgi:hypothetical protein